jgi:hypothetical protein
MPLLLRMYEATAEYACAPAGMTDGLRMGHPLLTARRDKTERIGLPLHVQPRYPTAVKNLVANW